MYGLRSCRLHLRIVWMLPNTEPLRGSKVTPVSEKGQGKGLLKKGHGSWAVGFEFGIILQCGCQYDSFVTFQLEVLTGYFWINFDCVFYFCAKCSICLKEMNFSAEWIHNCSRWIIYYQPTELQDSFFHKSTKKRLVAFLYWKSELLPILPRMTCSQNGPRGSFLAQGNVHRLARKHVLSGTLHFFWRGLHEKGRTKRSMQSYTKISYCSCGSHQFLRDPFVDAVLVGSLPQRDGLALCCALYFSGWVLL